MIRPSVVKSILVSLVITALITVGATSVALAAETGGVGGRPTTPDPNNSRTKSIFVFSMNPEEKEKSSVTIMNTSNKDQLIDVYAVDSVPSTGGAFACGQATEGSVGVGKWIKLDQTQVSLPAGEEVDIPFTITVPKGTAAGEHNGCIAIQEVNQTPQQAGNGIMLSFRSGIRVATTVKGNIKKELKFTGLSTESQGEKLSIISKLHNNGNVSLDANINTRIKSLFNTTIRSAGGEYPVLAGGESTFNFEVEPLYWGGFYFVDASAKYNADVNSGLGEKGDSATISEKKIFFSTPQPVALVIEAVVAIIAVGGIIWLCRRRRTSKKWKKHGVSYVVKEDDNIQKLAKEYNVSWKLIARENDIKAPYNLEPGETIKLLTTNKNSSKKATKKGNSKSEKTIRRKNKS